MSGLVRRLISAALAKDDRRNNPEAALALRPDARLAPPLEDRRLSSPIRDAQILYPAPAQQMMPAPPARRRERVVVVEEIYYREE